MRLCASAVLVLLLGLTWTRADPIPAPSPTAVAKECPKLEPLKDKSEFRGEYHFLAGYTDNDYAKEILNYTVSVWANVTEAEHGVNMDQFLKMNGSCYEVKSTVNITGDTATVTMHGVLSEMHIFHFNNHSLAMDLRASTSDISHISEILHVDVHLNKEQGKSMKAHSYYLIGNEDVVSQEDLHRFEDYAKCAGFTGEPDYIHTKDQEFCTMAESVLIPNDA